MRSLLLEQHPEKFKKSEEQAEDEMLKMFEVYLQAVPSRGSIRLCRLQKGKHF